MSNYCPAADLITISRFYGGDSNIVSGLVDSKKIVSGYHFLMPAKA